MITNDDKCGWTTCKYYEECPHNHGVHYDAWGEGIECRDALDRQNDDDPEVLPW